MELDDIQRGGAQSSADALRGGLSRLPHRRPARRAEVDAARGYGGDLRGGLGSAPTSGASSRNNTWLPLARPLEKDLVLWRFRGRLVSTSHTASFFLAFPPQAFKNLDALGPELHAIAVEQGSYIAAAAEGLPWQGQTFLDAMQKTDLTENEVRAEKHYRRSFDPALREEIKASLTAMTCALKTVDVLLAADTSRSSAITLWKLRYITLHHVLSGLRKLDVQYGAELRPPDRALLKEILDAPTSNLILQAHGGFRNTLVHYRPTRHVQDRLSHSAALRTPGRLLPYRWSAIARRRSRAPHRSRRQPHERLVRKLSPAGLAMRRLHRTPPGRYSRRRHWLERSHGR